MPKNDKQAELTAELCKLHERACIELLDFYLDPKTGYKVFTADYHKKRGTCCESGCRHCPYQDIVKK
jgi:hypothetical protein